MNISSEKHRDLYFVRNYWRKVCFLLENEEDYNSSTAESSGSVKEETDVGADCAELLSED